MHGRVRKPGSVCQLKLSTPSHPHPPKSGVPAFQLEEKSANTTKQTTAVSAACMQGGMVAKGAGLTNRAPAHRPAQYQHQGGLPLLSRVVTLRRLLFCITR